MARGRAATKAAIVMSTQRPSAAQPQPNLDSSLAKTQRREGKTNCHFERREKSLFRAKGEIIRRSLAFARDDRPWACHLASLRLGERNVRIRESSITGKFTQAARYDKHVGLCFRIVVRRSRRKDFPRSLC